MYEEVFPFQRIPAIVITVEEGLGKNPFRCFTLYSGNKFISLFQFAYLNYYLLLFLFSPNFHSMSSFYSYSFH